MNLDSVEEVRSRLIFSQETAAPNTHWHVPSAGHCAVAAIVMQMLLGGELVSAHVADVSHWFNRIDGYDIDITGDQFGYSILQALPAGELYPETRVRMHIEVNEETWIRARKLARNSNIEWKFHEALLPPA